MESETFLVALSSHHLSSAFLAVLKVVQEWVMRNRAPRMSSSSTKKACVTCKKNREKELRVDVKEDGNRI